MKKHIKFGVFGLRRGASFYKAILLNDGDIVAVCDRDTVKLNAAKEEIGCDVATYEDFESFLEHPGLEAVFLCNNFHQHAAFAIKALEKNIHVLSECTSNATMADGVALVRAARKSKAIYMIAENYPFMKFNREMKRIFDSGSLGKLLYAEGEYNHPLDPSDTKSIKKLRPYELHWRNFLPRSYYITHSLGPLMHITGAFPIRVTAMPIFAPESPDMLMGLDVGDRAAIITCLNNDNSVFRVTGCAAFGSHERSYRICGVNGQVENLRDGTERILLTYNKWNIPEGQSASMCYVPEWNDSQSDLIESSGHGGSDFLIIREFFDCIKQKKQPFFDVFCATTMASVAILSHRSLLERGVPYDIPDFHKEEDLQKYENDTLTPFYGENGEKPTLPCCSHPEFFPLSEDRENYKKIINSKSSSIEL